MISAEATVFGLRSVGRSHPPLLPQVGVTRLRVRAPARAPSGQGAALIVHGEPEIGKTALLEYTIEKDLGSVFRKLGLRSRTEPATSLRSGTLHTEVLASA
jgi:hypothetical protein